MLAITLELVYYFFSRVVTSFSYWRKNNDKPVWHRVIVILIHCFATVLPSEMLIFFGYNDGKSNDFKTKWLNLAWGRRITTVIRLII